MNATPCHAAPDGPALRCPRCGTPFEASAGCGATCGGCALLRCAACGHSFPHPRRSPLAAWLSRWLQADANPPPGAHKP